MSEGHFFCVGTKGNTWVQCTHGRVYAGTVLTLSISTPQFSAVWPPKVSSTPSGRSERITFGQQFNGFIVLGFVGLGVATSPF